MFCALEKHNGMQRYVPQLFVDNNDGTTKLVNEQSKVEKEIHKYYEGLFSNKDFANCDSIDTFLGENCNNIPKLSEVEKMNMEGKITLNEMTNYLKKCKNNVAPGSSGFSFDFYKFFWRDLKQFIIRSIDFAFEQNRLSVSQRLGIISIIPKGDKDKRYLSNWRPLCLLNSLYKLVSGAMLKELNLLWTPLLMVIKKVL